nr:MAG TPA: tail assembly chaperone protein [Caudoviricetes sp.]
MENIHKRETTSTYNMGGRNFLINSFDPMEGNYILAQILTFILPFGIGDMLKSSMGTEMKSDIGSTGKMMNKKDFINLQIDILKNVEEIFSTGEKSPVVRENGTYGISDVTMGILIKLIVATLAFNFKDFFDGIQSEDSTMGNLVSKFVNSKT